MRLKLHYWPRVQIYNGLLNYGANARAYWLRVWRIVIFINRGER